MPNWNRHATLSAPRKGRPCSPGLRGSAGSRSSASLAAVAALSASVAGLAPTALGGGPLSPFTEEAISRGIVYEVDFPQLVGIYGFGSGFSDLDGDGDADVLILGANDGVVGLFENDGHGHFTNRGPTCGISPLVKASSFVAGDLDGDGIVDLFISQIDAGNRIYRGLGGLQYVDVSAGSGTAVNGPCKAVSLADYDSDGDLDIFVPVYRNGSPGGIGKPSSLFRNDGGMHFTDVAAANGLTKPAYTFTGAWTDFDLDGDPDLYLSNDRGHIGPFFQGNQLFRNDNGQLVEISAASGAGVQLFSMGLAVGDFDGNGYPDFYCTNIATANQPTAGANPLLLNQGNGTFVRGDQLWGVSSFITSWGAEFFDFDNEGTIDLYVNNQFDLNSFFQNHPTPAATNISLAAGCPGAADGYSYASSAADIDADGDYDLLVGDLGSNAFLYVNHEGEKRNAVRIRVVGAPGNPSAIGATLRGQLDPGGPLLFRDIFAGGRSYLGHDLPEAHFGLGRRTALHAVTVRWPLGIEGGPTRIIHNLPAGDVWTVYPPSRLGDVDADGKLTSVDRQTLDTCSARGFIPGCEMMDFDGDSDVDGDDLFLFNHKASDFDGDGLVGPQDLAVMLGVWGTANVICDLSGDGSVGPEDLAALLGVWG